MEKINPLILKAVTIIDYVTGSFEVTQYNNSKAITIKNLVVITWLTRYLCPVEITYDQGYEFIGNEFKTYLIEE